MTIELPSFLEAALGDGRLLLEHDRLVREGFADRRASMELRLDPLPAHVGYAVVAGLGSFHERLDASTVDPAALDEAAGLLGLGAATVARLRAPRLAIDVDAMPDGTLAFGGEAIATIEGSLADVLVAATVTLPLVRRALCIATSASRLVVAAEGDALVEAASSEEASREAAALVARAAFVGGVEATANPIASVLVDVPLRAAASRHLAGLDAARTDDDATWSSLPPESWVPLDRGDEELALLEARRLGARPTGWIIRSFGGCPVGLEADLVALEEGGAWRAFSGSAWPGRKMAVRYVDADGRALCDGVFSFGERLRDPADLGATTYETLTRPLLRQGRPVAGAESAREARQRARTGRARFPADVLRLRSPAAFRVEREVARGARRSSPRW